MHTISDLLFVLHPLFFPITPPKVSELDMTHQAAKCRVNAFSKPLSLAFLLRNDLACALAHFVLSHSRLYFETTLLRQVTPTMALLHNFRPTASWTR
jgi:hypothetical protein